METDASNLDDHSRSIIHVDLDCFYAQVEMIKNPNLRTVPLGIQQKNIVVTSNYVARDHGIKKCMLLSEAKKLCPNLVLVKGEDLHDYKQMSYKVTNVLHGYSNLVERLGLDENYVDVTKLVNDRLNGDDISHVGHIFGDTSNLCDCGCTIRLKLASIIASEIRNKIKDELGLTSCAGIAHNKLLAKLVGAKHKPNEQTVVFPNGAMELMLSLPGISAIPGIGQVTSQQLTSLNIRTVEDLQQAGVGKLQGILGEKAAVTHYLSYGIDKSMVKNTGKPQSIGIEDSCKSISIETEVKEKLLHLLGRLLILVEEDGRIPKTIKLTIRKFDTKSKFSSRETRQSNINTTLFDPKNLSKLSEANENKLLIVIMRLFSKMVDTNKSYHLTLLGLSFTKFVEKPNSKNTLAMFLKNDLEVQTITDLQQTKIKDSRPRIMPSTSSFNSDSDADIEPTAKKHKKLNILMARRRYISDSDGCESPSKLRVAELRLNSTENLDNNQNICCPPNADEEVFKELPRDVQKELWDEYKQNRDRDVFTQINKRAKPNTILNYFVKH